jgi:hypothetical protein
MTMCAGAGAWSWHSAVFSDACFTHLTAPSQLSLCVPTHMSLCLCPPLALLLFADCGDTMHLVHMGFSIAAVVSFSTLAMLLVRPAQQTRPTTSAIVPVVSHQAVSHRPAGATLPGTCSSSSTYHVQHTSWIGDPWVFVAACKCFVLGCPPHPPTHPPAHLHLHLHLHLLLPRVSCAPGDCGP